MATKIDVLQVGYAYECEVSKMKASGSCCLVLSESEKILFDTMGPWERDSLITKLAALKIHPDDIDYLVCSHSHPDHIGNNNLFTGAKMHFVGTSVYKKDLYDLSLFEPNGSYSYNTSKNEEVEVVTHHGHKLTSHLVIEPTPGHTLECVSLFVESCDRYGSVALAGDLFESENDVSNEGIWLGAGSQSPNLQRAHRSRVYNRADYIVPGHGPMFKTVMQKPIIF